MGRISNNGTSAAEGTKIPAEQEKPLPILKGGGFPVSRTGALGARVSFSPGSFLSREKAGQRLAAISPRRL
jgi:hypothetical protein